jgi:uncharacterized SAM-binding protein YcdF (DUF218 family)
MLFVLSKIVVFFLKPLNILVMTGLYAFFTKNALRKRRAFRLSVFGLILFSNPYLPHAVASLWESGQRSPESIQTPYDIGILLGGYTQLTANTPPGQVSFFRADRLMNTLMLYKTGKIRRILLSGGSGHLLAKEEPEAQLVRRYLLQLGVPDSAMLLDDRSRNTRENAYYSKILLDSVAPNARCLLITSAWHMRRAMANFQKVGLYCDPYGTDYFSERASGNLLVWLEPDWKSFMKWDALIKEFIGQWAK